MLQGGGAERADPTGHPRQHLPRPQRAEQVRGVWGVELWDNNVVFTGVPPSSSWRISSTVMIQISKILYFVILGNLAMTPVSELIIFIDLEMIVFRVSE